MRNELSSLSITLIYALHTPDEHGQKVVLGNTFSAPTSDRDPIT